MKDSEGLANTGSFIFASGIAFHAVIFNSL